MIVHPEIEKYLMTLSPLPLEILEEMQKEAEKRNFPIVGPLVGRLLATLVKFGHVHTVLECGSGFGYSAMWIAYAIAENGKITCIEYDARNIRKAQAYFEKAGLAHKVVFRQGDACKILPTLQDTYDLILNDVDKEQYPGILPLILSRLRVGGMLITDNVLWQGKVTAATGDEATLAIQKYNQMLLQENTLWNTFLPLRDGLALSIKRKG